MMGDYLCGQGLLDQGNKRFDWHFVVARGAGLYLREWLPGLRIVRAFNSVWDQTLAKRAHCDGPQIGMPLASDDAEAMDVVVRLVRALIWWSWGICRGRGSLTMGRGTMRRR